MRPKRKVKRHIIRNGGIRKNIDIGIYVEDKVDCCRGKESQKMTAKNKLSAKK